MEGMELKKTITENELPRPSEVYQTLPNHFAIVYIYSEGFFISKGLCHGRSSHFQCQKELPSKEVNPLNPKILISLCCIAYHFSL